MIDVITLPDKLDSGAAAGLLSTIKAARGAPLTLDASESKSIGAICAQIIVAARSAWATDGHAFVLTRWASIADDLRLLGLHDQFDEANISS
ncbi:hypothetical protein ACOI1H_07755 [Loktanella sp. DJP18]|uniref:hypothetical protein n=1 Tax=Loktanella sp. DJP18 TaxID=3409788 RepID=UPI003BB5CD09